MMAPDKTEKLVKKMRYRATAEAYDKALGAFLRAVDEHAKQKSVSPQPNLWRTIMKSPITRFAVAAVLVIACLMGIMMWKGTGSSVTLANVLTQIQQFNAYRYQSTISVTGLKVGDRTVDQVTHATTLMFRDGGWKMTMKTQDPNGTQKSMQEFYLLPAKKIMLTLMPDTKRYVELELDEARLQNEQKQHNDPRVVIQQLLDRNYVSLGRSTIDGLEVEGFRTTVPRQVGAIMAQADVKIWIDVKTQLPVRSETDIRNGQMRLYSLDDKFQWDVPIDPKEFEPVIPPNYTPLTDTPVKYPPLTEETLIKGLKRFGEMTGRYPDELSAIAIAPKLQELFVEEFMGDAKGTSKEEALKKLMANKEIVTNWLGKTMPVAAAATFYDALVQGSRDPAYYGKTVAPKDAHKVLLRWKVSDREYRVIYGDLHAETVSPEKLAELEKALPK
jgi:outer membrane lipoprotein-sorting protein